MPTFGFSDVELQTISDYFLATHNREYVMTNYTYKPNPELIPAGKYLFDKLKCLSCHYVGGSQNAETKAPSLSVLKRRIRPDWLPHWLARPDSIVPGTPMTAFWWASGKPAPADSILGGDYQMQIRAVIDYVWSINTDEMPPSTPYAVVNGVERYVLPDGSYTVIASNMMSNAAGAGVASQASRKIEGSKKTAMR
jgi:cytochrome c2